MEFGKRIQELFAEAKQTIKNEKKELIRSVDILGKLHLDKAACYLGFSSIETYIKSLGLSPKQYYTRIAVYNVILYFPELKAMWEAGETELSVLSLLQPKITQANYEQVVAGIRGKSKRDAEFFLSRIDEFGNIIEKQATIDLKISVSMDEMNEIELLRDVLAAGGKNPNYKEAILKAISDSLYKRDPMQKAERALKKSEKKLLSENELSSSVEAKSQKSDGKKCDSRDHCDFESTKKTAAMTEFSQLSPETIQDHSSADQRSESDSRCQLDSKTTTYSQLSPETIQDHSSADQRSESDSRCQLDSKTTTYSQLSPETIQDHSSADQRSESDSRCQLDSKTTTYSQLSPETIQNHEFIKQKQMADSYNQFDSVTTFSDISSSDINWGQAKRIRIPNQRQHSVWLRDQRQCDFHNSKGERCSATRMLEIDHRIPVTRGGTNDLSNLSLRCRMHNLYQAELLMGKGRIAQYQNPIHSQ